MSLSRLEAANGRDRRVVKSILPFRRGHRHFLGTRPLWLRVKIRGPAY